MRIVMQNGTGPALLWDFASSVMVGVRVVTVWRSVGVLLDTVAWPRHRSKGAAILLVACILIFFVFDLYHRDW